MKDTKCGYKRCYVTVCADLTECGGGELTDDDVQMFFENTLYDFPNVLTDDGRLIIANCEISDITM